LSTYIQTNYEQVDILLYMETEGVYNCIK